MLPPQLLTMLHSLLDSSSILGSVSSTGLLDKLLNKASYKPMPDDFPIKVLQEMKDKQKKPFRDVLLDYIDKSGRTDPDVYKNAGCSRQLFYKIKNQKDYRVSKDLAVAFCFALELDTDNAIKLLKSGGFALADGDKRDIVFALCISNEVYNIMNVNELLDVAGLPPLGHTN